MKEYRYKTTFASKIHLIEDKSEQDRFISIASKNDNIRKLLPKETDLTSNAGFVLFSGEGFVANLLNANNDGVGTKEAKTLAQGVPFTYLDVNHSRTRVCGVMVASAFTDYKTGKQLSEKEIDKTEDPFSVTVTGIVWAATYPELANEIKNINNNDSELKDSVFLSWECGFDKFNLLLIDPKKTKFSEGQIVTDESQIDRFLDKMVSNGGNGLTDDGLKIGRVPIGDVLLLGFGLTENPAAAVGPIQVNKDIKTNASNDMENVIDNETKENKSKPKEIDTIEMFKSAYPKPIKKLYKKLQKSKITEAEFSESLRSLIEAYNISLNDNKIEYAFSFGECPSCKTLNADESTRYDNGKIFCGSCGTLSLGSTWKNNKKLPLGNTLEDLYKVIDLQLTQGNVNDYKTKLTLESCASKDNHKTIKCSCGNIISQCRCSFANKPVEIVEKGCTSCKNSENLISQAENANVITNNDNIISNMKIEKIDQLTDENLKTLKCSEVKELFASANREFIDQKIKEISDEYTKKLSERENSIKAANEDIDKLKTSAKDLQSKFNEVEVNYNKLIAENQQREQVERFSNRMNDIESKFDLDDKQKEIVANKVKTLGTDEDYDKYLAEIDVLLAAKKKVAKKGKTPDKGNDNDSDDNSQDNSGKQNSSTASDNTSTDSKVIEATIANGKQDAGNAVPNSTAAPETVAQRAKKAFGIEGWETVDKRKNRVM